MSDPTIMVKDDPQGDILRIRFNNSPIEESEEIQPGMIVDYDSVGNIVGFELLDASEVVQRPEYAGVVHNK
jgi:uncharacterized protein YuzE